MTPLKAIRLKCMECSCGQTAEVRYCPIKDCPLWVYRDGHNPARKGIGGNFGGDGKEEEPVYICG